MSGTKNRIFASFAVLSHRKLLLYCLTRNLFMNFFAQSANWSSSFSFFFSFSVCLSAIFSVLLNLRLVKNTHTVWGREIVEIRTPLVRLESLRQGGEWGEEDNVEEQVEHVDFQHKAVPGRDTVWEWERLKLESHVHIAVHTQELPFLLIQKEDLMARHSLWSFNVRKIWGKVRNFPHVLN